MSKNSYGNESISALKGAERVRKRPGVIFGSDGIEGCQHAVFEVISNSIDEHRAGYGGKIVVTRFKDGSIEVVDFGRGVPVEFNEKEQRYNWELIYCELYAGGKYEQEGDYEYSLGLNGLGLCSTQYASDFMYVESLRDGKKHILNFEKGENVGGLKSESYSGRKTGTLTRWKPDLDVFTDIAIPLEFYTDILKRQAIVNSGLLFVLKNQTDSGFETFEFKYDEGIRGYVDEIIGENGLTPVKFFDCERQGRDREDKPEYKVKINVAIAFSNIVSIKEYYHNSSFLEHGGAPDKATRSALVSQIDNLIKNLNKYQKGESKITFHDIEESLCLVISSFSTVTSYENQTKKAINNKFIQEAITDFLKSQLEIYFIENPAEAEKIAEQILINKRSREKSEKERLNLKKALQTSGSIADKVAKFVDCRSREVEERELFIVEGDSALGACKLARDPFFQAIIPVRGKILNCLKADYGKIFKNEIITDLIKVLGCGVEVSTKAKDMATFNINALRWGKIIICTDADYDGFQIRTLILTMLYRLTPSLIKAGKVYIAETPLYEINTKDKTYFAYDEAEKADALREIGEAKYTIQRSKGLGENQPDMMNLTTMNPASRRLVKVLQEDCEGAEYMFEVLLGDNLAARKEFIATNGAEYADMADVS